MKLESALFKVLNILTKFLTIYTFFVMLWLFVSAVSHMQFPSETLFNNEAVRENNQGMGFASLSDYMDIWKVFRNLGYLYVIFLTVLSGIFGFWLSVKKRPTVEFKKPVIRIVTNMPLLTFSYALVGLSIDIIFLAYFVSKSY